MGLRTMRIPCSTVQPTERYSCTAMVVPRIDFKGGLGHAPLPVDAQTALEEGSRPAPATPGPSDRDVLGVAAARGAWTSYLVVQNNACYIPAIPSNQPQRRLPLRLASPGLKVRLHGVKWRHRRRSLPRAMPARSGGGGRPAPSAA